MNELPLVRLDPSGGYKYILASVLLADGTQMLVVRADQTCDYHRDILAKLRCENGVVRAACLGGGQVRVDPMAKSIRTWDYSGDFGPPDYAKVDELVRAAYPDYSITIE